MIDNEPILTRFARGDRSAVEECLDLFGGLVRATARRFFGEADAEDMIQEIFLDVWKCAGRCDPSVARESTFIMTIARRRLIDQKRRQARAPETSALGEEVTVDPVASSDRLEVADEVSKVRTALETLDGDRRHVLELSVHHGLSHEGIARQLEMPLGTVKSHARRALLHVRQLLLGEEERESARSAAGGGALT